MDIFAMISFCIKSTLVTPKLKKVMHALRNVYTENKFLRRKRRIIIQK